MSNERHQRLGNAMTITNKVIRLVAAAAAVLSFGHAQAHHSYAAFDRCKPVALEGEINSVEWANPHIVINLRTADVASYRVEWFSVVQLQRAGLAEPLTAGDRVIIVGSAMRDPALKVLSLVTEIRRPSDGWTWNGRPRPVSLECTDG